MTNTYEDIHGFKSGEVLFSEEQLVPWVAHWQNMPEYDHQDMQSKFDIVVHFATEKDVEDFLELLGQKVNRKNDRYSPSIWFPMAEIGRYANLRFVEANL